MSTMSSSGKKVSNQSLDTLDMSLKLGPSSYETNLLKLQKKLMKIQQAYLLSGRSAVAIPGLSER